MNKRVLLIAFHFPPQAASSGIQRTLSFSKHLGQYGWEPMILSAHPRAYGQKNSSQLASIPQHLVVKRAFALDSKRHAGFRGRYLEILALPDRWISWWFGAVPAGLSLIRRHKPDVIWSTFPIATAHLIGLTLHRLTGIAWIADFRDPMLQSSYPTSRLQRSIYGWIERHTLNRCHTAVFTTHSAMQSCMARFPHLPATKFKVIENGYDESGFFAYDEAAASVSERNPRLTLVHSGVLYDTGRNPQPFLRAIASLKAQARVDGATLRVVLRAPGEIEQISAMVRESGVEDIVEVAPPIPYREALNEMLAADGLLVFQGTPFNTQIPAKIYEYFRARKPIMALVDPAGETARVLNRAGFDDIAMMNDADAIATALPTFLERVISGRARIADDALVEASSREYRARELASVLDQASTA